MDYGSFQEVIEQFKTLFSDLSTSGAIGQVYGGVRWVGVFAIFIMFVKSILQILSSGGERPVRWFEDVFKPLFLIFILLNWISAMGFIGGVAKSLAGAIEGVAKTGEIQGTISEKFGDQQKDLLFRIEMEYLMEDATAESESGEPGSFGEDNDIFDDIGDAFSEAGNTITNPISSLYREIEMMYYQARVNSAEALSSFAITVQNLVSIMFYGYAGLILVLLQIVGPIALVLALFPSMSQGFFSWLKNYIAVIMWFPVAGLIFFVVDEMYIKTMEMFDLYVADLAGYNASGLNQGDWHFEGTFNEMLALYRKQAWIYIAFGILKGILMFKIPQIVSMFVGSSSSSGGMFGAVFAPVKMATGGVKSMVSGGSGKLMR